MANKKLTDLSTASAVTNDSLVHIVNTGDTSQSPSGSSYKATIQQIFDSMSGETIIDIEYLDLYNDIVNETLVPRQWYRLVNYKSVNFLNGWEIARDNPTPIEPSFNPREIYGGEGEVLLLQALSTSKLNPIAYSETYPQDILEYQAYTNKIGTDIEIFNGNTLPDNSTVSGFDLQWDGTNVYFEMPLGYPALFGHYFYIYCDFDGGNYNQNGTFEPLTPGVSVCQYPSTSNQSRILVTNGGTKIILLDLTETDYLNYDVDTLYVDTVYSLGDAYGWVTRRNDTERKIDVPFDFRGRKYRRYLVDFTSINPSLGINYYGQGDNYLGLGTTGDFIDIPVFVGGTNLKIVYNIEWSDLGGPNMFWYCGFNDNVIFLTFCYSNKIGAFFHSNTVKGIFFQNTISEICSNNSLDSLIGNNIKAGFTSNKLGSFSSNEVFSGFFNNSIGSSCNGNRFNFQISNNIIGNNFRFNFINTSISNLNFTSATHVYGNYNTTIFLRSNNTSQLSYIDGTNTIQYASPNA
jgi:hypothetical protein